MADSDHPNCHNPTSGKNDTWTDGGMLDKCDTIHGPLVIVTMLYSVTLRDGI